MITLIAAAAENNALGKDNDLLWHLPDDFKRFKKLTSGHPIIMGRKTFDSLPGMLPNRQHIIITRQKDYKQKDCLVANSLEEALLLVAEKEMVFIIGGGEIYKQSLAVADSIELTRVHTEIEADTFFPEIDAHVWEVTQEEFHKKDERHRYDFTFVTYGRKKYK